VKIGLAVRPWAQEQEKSTRQDS